MALFEKKTSFFGCRDIRQGLVRAQTLAHCSRKKGIPTLVGTPLSFQIIPQGKELCQSKSP